MATVASSMEGGVRGQEIDFFDRKGFDLGTKPHWIK
jgi:hypothetical protein